MHKKNKNLSLLKVKFQKILKFAIKFFKNKQHHLRK